MPMTAIPRGRPRAGVLARMTASSAASSTATHTEVNALHTAVTSSMPSKIGRRDAGQFATAQRARGGDRRSPDRRRAADAISARERWYPVLTSNSLGPCGPSAYCWIGTSGARISRSGHEGRRAQHPHQPLGHRALVAQRRDRNQRCSANSSQILRYASSPASGSGVCESHSSSVGSSTCCTRPRRPPGLR